MPFALGATRRMEQSGWSVGVAAGSMTSAWKRSYLIAMILSILFKLATMFCFHTFFFPIYCLEYSGS